MSEKAPQLGECLTEEVLKVGDKYWAANGAREYKRSELEQVGPFFFVKTKDED